MSKTKFTRIAIVNPNNPYFALLHDNNSKLYSSVVNGTRLNSTEVLNPLMCMHTLQLKMCSYDEFVEVSENIGRRALNFLVCKEGIEIYTDRMNHAFEVLLGQAHIFINEFVRLIIGNVDLTFWVEYNRVYCNTELITVIEYPDFYNHSLWIVDSYPVKFLYQPLPGIYLLQLGLYINHSSMDTNRRKAIVISILINTNKGAKSIMYVHTTDKKYTLSSKYTTYDEENSYIIDILKKNKVFNDVLNHRIHV